MAGNDGGPQSPLDAGDAPKPRIPKLRTFSCKQCGASISLRNSDSLTVVCDSCHSIIDSSDENYQILQSYKGAIGAFKPQIQLGSRTELFGKKWEVIGFIVREDVASHFQWEEYLLFNPYQGYRWLTCSDRRWNFVTPIKAKPDRTTLPLCAVYKKEKYRLFDRGKVTNLFVLGEFYWQVSRNSSVQMEDYIRPPEMLSLEKDHNEINWSLGVHVETKIITNAFNLKTYDKYSFSTIAPNEVSKNTVLFKKILMWWVGFIVFLTMAQFWFVSTCKNQLSSSNTYIFNANQKSTTTITTPTFKLAKDSANLNIIVQAPVSNSWFYIDGELVNNDNGTSYPFDRSVEFYSGSDSDGAWSEGSRSATIGLSSVPGGTYYLNIDYESGEFSSFFGSGQFTVSVIRDVPTYSNYLWCLIFVSIVPFIFWHRSSVDESKRWSNSDFSPYSQGS